jgi:integrase/recombinase XerD
MMNVQESTSIILAFKEHLIADGKSYSTIKSYIGDIAAFVDFLSSKGVSFEGDLKRFYVTSYRKHLVEREYEVNTINKKINSLQSLNQFLIDQGKMTEQVVVTRKDKVKTAAGVNTS